MGEAGGRLRDPVADRQERDDRRDAQTDAAVSIVRPIRRSRLLTINSAIGRSPR
jgi:hypothetical protein